MKFYKGALVALALGTASLSGCGAETSEQTQTADNNKNVGTVGMALTLPDDSGITSVSYTITGPNSYSRTGSVPVGTSKTATFRVSGLPVGNGYNVALSASTGFGNGCAGAGSFNVTNGFVRVGVLLTCNAQDNHGDLIVDGTFDSCPLVTAVGAVPAEVNVGGTIVLTSLISHGDTPVLWSGTGGTFADANAYDTTFTCATEGTHVLTVAVNGAQANCTSASTVSVECTLGANCGNGVVDPGTAEVCDDGNTVNTDACTTSCALARCGDSFVQAGVEECDDGNAVDTDTCSNACGSNVCGDGNVDPGETCDDGNTVNTDACSNACRPAGCGDGIPQPGEACDDGNTVQTDACTNACQAARCGDTFVQAGEQCDDGNTVDTDSCSNACQTVALVGDTANQIAACRSCRQANCTNFFGLLDLYTQCFLNPDPSFVEKCVDAKNCAYDNDCGYNAQGLNQCFCGTADVSACQTAGNANGPCMDEIFAAANTTSLPVLIGSFTDVSLPVGIATYFVQCDYESCATDCAP